MIGVPQSWEIHSMLWAEAQRFLSTRNHPLSPIEDLCHWVYYMVARFWITIKSRSKTRLGVLSHPQTKLVNSTNPFSFGVFCWKTMVIWLKPQTASQIMINPLTLPSIPWWNLCNAIPMTGWSCQPLWKIWLRQLGWLFHSQYFWTNHPVMFQSPPTSK